MTFQEEVIDRLARIEEGMANHPREHGELGRRIEGLEEEQKFRARTTVLVSSITSAIVSAIGHFVPGARQ